MSQRNSEYARQEADAYWTPQWVFDVLFVVENFDGWFDPAPRNADFDFLARTEWPGNVVTNPPFSLAEEFIRHSLDLAKPVCGKVAMLLPHAYDTAKGRVDLFCHLPFKCKYTLTKRIRWENLEQKKAGPSTNHAWFVWDWRYIGPPKMGWLPLTNGAA